MLYQWSTLLGRVAHTSDDTRILLQWSELCSKPDESMEERGVVTLIANDSSILSKKLFFSNVYVASWLYILNNIQSLPYIDIQHLTKKCIPINT